MKIKTEEERFKIPRKIITFSFLGLIIFYIILIATGIASPSSWIMGLILLLAGVLLFTLGLVIYNQGKRVDLDYDSTVVWKMCCVAGVLFFAGGIVSIIVSF